MARHVGAGGTFVRCQIVEIVSLRPVKLPPLPRQFKVCPVDAHLDGIGPLRAGILFTSRLDLLLARGTT